MQIGLIVDNEPKLISVNNIDKVKTCDLATTANSNYECIIKTVGGKEIRMFDLNELIEGVEDVLG